MNSAGSRGTVDRALPTGWLRWLLRLPIVLFRLMIAEELDGSPGQYGRLAARVPVLELAPAIYRGPSNGA